MIKAEDNITLVSNKATHDIASDTAQFFWVEETGTDTGVHITEVTKDEFLADPSGGNLLARSNGLAVRDGLEEIATFSADGVQIGQDNGLYASLTTTSFRFGRAGNSVFSAQAGTVTDTFTGDGSTTMFTLSSVPMSFHAEDTTVTVGGTTVDPSEYSVFRFGGWVIDFASAPPASSAVKVTYYSTARSYAGVGTPWQPAFIGECAFFVGSCNPTGKYSMAQGSYTRAGNNAFASGIRSIANGEASVAMNYYTSAQGDYQTVVGKYNEKDANCAFIVGNGADGENRSNALAVDWQGNLAIAGQHQELFKVTQVTKVLTGGINANSYIQATNIAMTSVDGYNAVGIVGHSSSNFRVQPTSEYVASNSAIFAGFANWSASNVTSDVTVIFYVLWLKATQA